MKKLTRFLYAITLICVIYSCTKEDFSNQKDIAPKYLVQNQFHGGTDYGELSKNLISIEEFPDLEKFVDHTIYSSLQSILPERFSSKEIQQLEQGYVWKFEKDGTIIYTIDYEYNVGSITKLMVTTGMEGAIISINLVEAVIKTTNNSISVHDIELEEVNIYAILDDQEGKSGRNSIKECMKIVFGVDSGNSTVIINPKGNTSNNGTVGGGDGPTGGGGTANFIVVCGCTPGHMGGKSNPDCKCKKTDKVIIIGKDNTLTDNSPTSTTRNQEYWDCIERLIGCVMLTDYDLALLTLKHCNGVYDVNDIDPQAGNDGSNQFIGPEFCGNWFDYQQECLDGNTSVADVYQPWSQFMADFPDLFFEIIEGLPECTDTDEMEEIACVQEALDAFLAENNLTLTKQDETAIKNAASCGEDMDSIATTYFENINFVVELEDDGGIVDLKQLVEDCFGMPDANGNFVDCSNGSDVFNFTIYVDQPKQGSSDPYSGSIFKPSTINVGHTFVSMTHTSGGVSNTIVYGLYPSNGANPLDPESPRYIVDDGGHQFDIAMSYNISCGEFNDILGESLNIEGDNYNLNSNNCTDFGLNLGGVIDCCIPDSQGFWGVGSGSNPGALGEDLKNHQNQNATLLNGPQNAPITDCN
ncbi:MAG: hypothetical protein P1U56_07845 [Saprospiraceae bacterium]|nr:hypothetical protein [Saprospiraceae bacterium]